MKLDPKIGRSLKKASPTILTCIGAAGVVATAVLAVKVTPKADSLIKADSWRNHDGDPYAATKLEAVKSCWKCYIPAAATGVTTIICIFGANTLNKKQQASFASAYALVNRSYSDYKHKLKELYGEDAHKKIMESIAAEKSSMPPITATGGFSNSSLEFEDGNHKPSPASRISHQQEYGSRRVRNSERFLRLPWNKPCRRRRCCWLVAV